MFNKFLKISVVVLAAAAVTACSNMGGSSNSSVATSAAPAPAGTPFAKIKPGMSIKQVHDLIGQPSDSTSKDTGMGYIPFYSLVSGRGIIRFFDFYKGQGSIVYTSNSSGGDMRVDEVRYDKTEDGYSNR